MLRNIAIGAVVGFLAAVVMVSVFEKSAAPPPPAPTAPTVLQLPAPTVARPPMVVPTIDESDPTAHLRRPRAAGAVAPAGLEDGGP